MNSNHILQALFDSHDNAEQSVLFQVNMGCVPLFLNAGRFHFLKDC